MPLTAMLLLTAASLWGTAVLAQGVTVLAQTTPSSSTHIAIPMALITVGLGLIATLLKLTYSMGISAATIKGELVALGAAVTGLREAISREREQRQEDRSALQAAITEVRASVAEVARQQGQLEVRVARLDIPSAQRPVR